MLNESIIQHFALACRQAGSTFNINTVTYWKLLDKVSLPEKEGLKKIKAYEQLVLLGFAVTSFTPVAYQRSRLLRLLKVNSS